MGKISPHIGKSIPELKANFEIGVTPSEEQVGKNITLVTSTKFRGNDTNTGNLIEIETDAITSNLTNDPVAKGKGVVVR